MADLFKDNRVAKEMARGIEVELDLIEVRRELLKYKNALADIYQNAPRAQHIGMPLYAIGTPLYAEDIVEIAKKYGVEL